MSGPLAGVRVIELAGIGPGPFCAMMLADMGADVIRVDRAGAVRGGDPAAPPADVLNRGRRSIGIDLKTDEGLAVARRLIDGADVLIEGFRPGVTERLGLGPDGCLDRNPKLVYGRMTGWGQDGPWAGRAGHDINYIALSGTLSMVGRAGERPVPPMNLVGDFGGGGMLLAFGVLAGVIEARTSGAGQVVDAAMVDGSAVLATMMYAMRAMGVWDGGRGGNMLDTGAHFYEVYETSDQKFIALGGIEVQFYDEMLERLGIAPESIAEQHDRNRWPESKAVIAARVAERTRDEWEVVFDGSDACFAPVLEAGEAPKHPHNAARSTFITVAGVEQPAPAPRFSRTPSSTPAPPAHAGQNTDEVLLAAGFTSDEIDGLHEVGAVA
ncbi:MAG: CaiB/BaiF CoA transferase family protein [Acidimicrobiales bacterium]